MAITRINHVVLNVEDMDASLDFHRDALGLEEIGREGDVVYLGFDSAYVIGLSPGGTGIDHFAAEVDFDADLDSYAGRLAEMGIEVERRSDDEPGLNESIRFTAPTGHVVELVAEASFAEQLGGTIAPAGLDHVTLRTGNPHELADFFAAAIDCKISDAAVAPPVPGGWGGAWTRFGDRHHDLAMLASPPPRAGDTLDHVAWSMRDFEHYRTSCDALSELEIPLEVGIGRHRLGGNTFAYFWSPGGNRYELSGFMPDVPEGTETGLWEDFNHAFSAWGQIPPESFQRGS